MKQINFNTAWRIDNFLLILPILIVMCFTPNWVVAEDSHDHDHQKHQVNEHKENGHENEHEHEDEHDLPELKFTNAELKEFSIELAQVSSGVINKTIDLTGEVIIEPEHLYHIAPRVSGVVLQVFKHLGDTVKAGDLMATLSSRNLADAKVQFVAADSLLKLANTNLKRERKLYKGNVSAKRKYLTAKQTQAEISVKRKVAKQQLTAMGLTEEAIHSVLQDDDKDLTLYELRALSDGIIIDKHVVKGEVLDHNTSYFTVADLSSVWVNFTIYQKDLPFIRPGLAVQISSHFGLNNPELSANSTISWVSPTLDESTRSATARVVIENHKGHWRPGLFVTGKVTVTNTNEASIVVPLSALQTIEGKTVIFVQHEEGEFEAQSVIPGHQDSYQIEILQGLKIGQTFISKNAFALKAQLQKGDFGHGHSH